MSKFIDLRIQVLRGVCVLSVVLFHLFPSNFRLGYLGVDAFFVISGFLMAKIYGEIRTKQEITNFYLKRLNRLLPAYAFTIVVTCIVAFLILLPHELAVLSQHIRWSVTLLPNVGYWTDSQYWGSADFRPLLNLWSLGIELQFYLFFPLLARFLKSNRLLILITVLNYAFYSLINLVSEKSAFFLLPSRFWEFTVGILAFRLSNSADSNLLSRRIRLFMFAQFILFIVTVNVITSAWVGLVVFSVGAFLVSPIRSMCSLGVVNLFRLIGDYSYSIYLIHYPLLAFTYYESFESNSRIDAFQSPWKLLVYLTLLFLLSWLSRNFVELKLGVDLKFQVFLIFSLSLILVSTFISNAGLRAVTLDKKYLQISNSVRDFAPYRCGKVSRFFNPLGQVCRLNESHGSTAKYLLLGDSHADMLKKPLIRNANQKNIELWLWQKNESINFSNYSEFKEIIESGRFERIIVTSNYGGTNFELLSQMINETKNTSIHWVYIDSIPTYPISIPQALFQGDRNLIQGIKLTRSEFLNSRADEMTFIGSFSLDTQFSNVSLTDYLCPESCIFERGGLPIYSDSNHLTQREVSRLSKLLKPVING